MTYPYVKFEKDDGEVGEPISPTVFEMCLNCLQKSDPEESKMVLP